MPSVLSWSARVPCRLVTQPFPTSIGLCFILPSRRYDLELLDFEPPNEDEDNQAGMTFEARMEAAERRRQDGNALFRQEQYSQALGKYRCDSSHEGTPLVL